MREEALAVSGLAKTSRNAITTPRCIATAGRFSQCRLFDLVDCCERAPVVGKGQVAPWTYWQNRPSRNYTRQRSESFQRLRRGCRHDEEAKIAPGRADFIGSIEGTNHEGRAAARAETVKGKKAGSGKLRSRGSVVENC